jgi:hypothetical protein
MYRTSSWEHHNNTFLLGCTCRHPLATVARFVVAAHYARLDVARHEYADAFCEHTYLLRNGLVDIEEGIDAYYYRPTHCNNAHQVLLKSCTMKNVGPGRLLLPACSAACCLLHTTSV